MELSRKHAIQIYIFAIFKFNITIQIYLLFKVAKVVSFLSSPTPKLSVANRIN